MGLFDQAKLAADMMKNMDPSEMKELLAQARESQKMIEDQIKKVVDEEVQKRDLVSRKEVEEIIKNMLAHRSSDGD